MKKILLMIAMIFSLNSLLAQSFEMKLSVQEEMTMSQYDGWWVSETSEMTGFLELKGNYQGQNLQRTLPVTERDDNTMYSIKKIDSNKLAVRHEISGKVFSLHASMESDHDGLKSVRVQKSQMQFMFDYLLENDENFRREMSSVSGDFDFELAINASEMTCQRSYQMEMKCKFSFEMKMMMNK